MRILMILATIIGVAFALAGCSDKSVSVPDTISPDTPVYHISGTKDARLDAVMSTTFVATNINSSKCSSKGAFGDRRKPSFLSKNYFVQDGNYSINIPIEFSDDTDGCGYKLIGLNLLMRRHGDGGMHSNYYLLTDRKINNLNNLCVDNLQAIGLCGGDKRVYEDEFKTDKKYFRIAQVTSFLCRTEYHDFKGYSEEFKNASGFYCIMQINSGYAEPRIFIRNWKKKPDGTSYLEYGHNKDPQFGVDEIVNSNLTVNIIADDDGSTYISNHDNNHTRGEVPDRLRDYIPPNWLRYMTKVTMK
jgi:hypothetical protein